MKIENLQKLEQKEKIIIEKINNLFTNNNINVFKEIKKTKEVFVQFNKSSIKFELKDISLHELFNDIEKYIKRHTIDYFYTNRFYYEKENIKVYLDYIKQHIPLRNFDIDENRFINLLLNEIKQKSISNVDFIEYKRTTLIVTKLNKDIFSYITSHIKNSDLYKSNNVFSYTLFDVKKDIDNNIFSDILIGKSLLVEYKKEDIF